MSFMDEVQKAYVKVSKQIKENPRICELCGKKETMYDLFLNMTTENICVTNVHLCIMRV